MPPQILAYISDVERMPATTTKWQKPILLISRAVGAPGFGYNPLSTMA